MIGKLRPFLFYNQHLPCSGIVASAKVIETDGPHHQYAWYDFSRPDIGQPLCPKAKFYENTEGLFVCEFTNDRTVYNRSGRAHEISLSEEAISISNGLTAALHAPPDMDGGIHFKVKPKNSADVSGEGIVNILDLAPVRHGFGIHDPDADVNGDGFVSILDVAFVAYEF